MTTRRLTSEAQAIKQLQRAVADLQAKLGRVGSVVTSGVTADGEWARLGSGLLVCRVLLSVTANPTTWTFPVSFGANPDVAATAVSTGGRFATWAARSTTGVSIYVWDTTPAFPGTTNVNVFAFGQEA